MCDSFNTNSREKLTKKVLKKYKKWYRIFLLEGEQMIKNAESLAAVYTHTGIFTNEKTLVAFLYPKISNKAK